MNYPVLTLKPKRERSILLRHPWIFSGAVQAMPKLEDGEIVAVVAAGGEILGHGFFSPQSQIVCRMFDWGAEPSDFESADYWHGKFSRAKALRDELVLNEGTNTYRLLHAEGDFMPGIIADVYGDVVSVQVLIKGIERRLPQITEALVRLGFQQIFVKSKSSSRVIENVNAGGWLHGEATSPVEVIENGLRFQVDFIHGQKTGFFVDQRDNRKLLGQYSKGKTVLNTFSYTGGFSVYALAAGAARVVSVDVSEEAIRVCNENVALNGMQEAHTGVVADCFEYLKDMPADEFDILVLDPPAFAKHARSVPNATRGYKQINLQAFRKIKPGGLVFTFSCSQNISADLFQKIIFGAAADAGRNIRILHKLTQSPDHPVNIYHPEGEYLKGLVLWVE